MGRSLGNDDVPMWHSTIGERASPLMFQCKSGIGLLQAAQCLCASFPSELRKMCSVLARSGVDSMALRY